MSLTTLRREINKIDNRITQLLNQRARITLKIGQIKSRMGKSIYAPDREDEILRRLTKKNKGPLSKDALLAIYREIMSSSLSLEKPLKIAYLGPQATFTHLAALKKFGSQVEYIGCDSIADVFLEVEKGLVDYGVVPVENSIEGAVTHTLDMLVDSDLKICSQIILDISHNLLANCPMNKIKRIYSNPQVFGQCRLWLDEHLPHIERIEVSSTTRAAQIAAKEKESGCIASFLAAKVYKLKIIARDIEDSPHNITRFLVIGNTEVPPTGNDRTSILFSIKDRVGALHDMLIPFKKYGINLTKIESRPSKKKLWDYFFFIDFNGHYKDTKVKKALQELEDRCKFLKVLGSYPKGE
ncbi:MAG: prephenate dehydratase [Candidatus Omnitrophica bacterium]|nr:prephenate dehydratase [Candidatus Omnitrophota bacterium]MCM8771208.1 prephenate dehydratase [Candidatus Omnitrophota bacterium]